MYAGIVVVAVVVAVVAAVVVAVVVGVVGLTGVHGTCAAAIVPLGIDAPAATHPSARNAVSITTKF